MNSTVPIEDSTSESSGGYEWWRFVIIIGLSLLSAVFSGLNLGIIGLDPGYLELLTMGPFETKEDERDASYAKRILPLRRRGNLLICTILLGNVSVNSILSIIMADMTSGIAGMLITTGIVMIFGEIIPQAVCSRYALVIGAHTMWILYIVVFITFPITFPLSAILDKILGEDVGNVYNKNKMKRLFEIYEKEKLLDPQERKILTAALELHEKSTDKVMTPLDKVFKLDIDLPVDKELLRHIYSQGYSRIPIYQGSPDNIVGILLARDLILINPDKKKITIRQLSSMLVRDVVQIDHTTKLEPLLTFFKKGQSHMAVVTKVEESTDGRDPQLKMIGIITLEDIIKELVQQNDDEEEDFVQLKGEQLRHKEKLVLLFSNFTSQRIYKCVGSDQQQKGGSTLSDAECQAVCEFLQKQVKAFNQSRVKRKVLIRLLTQTCQVLEIRSDQPTVPLGQKYRLPKMGPLYYNDGGIKHIVLQSSASKVQQITLHGAKPNDPGVPMLAPKVSKDIIAKKDQQEDEIVDADDINLKEKTLEQSDQGILMQKGKPSDEFYLILQGKVIVESGAEGFIVQLSTFSYFGLDGLLTDSYTPDFTAKVSKYARVLRVKRIDYLKAISSLENFN